MVPIQFDALTEVAHVSHMVQQLFACGPGLRGKDDEIVCTLNFNRIDFFARCGELVRERNDLGFECDELDFLRLVLDFELINGVALLAEFGQRIAMLIF